MNGLLRRVVVGAAVREAEARAAGAREAEARAAARAAEAREASAAEAETLNAAAHTVARLAQFKSSFYTFVLLAKKDANRRSSDSDNY